MLKKILYIPKPIQIVVALSVFLATVRILIWGTLTFSFIYWNICLAIIPFFMSSFILYLSDNFKLKHYLIILGIIIWLIFLPNTFYIVTDLVHIGKIKAVPVFFDVVLVFSSAIAGVLLGVNSVFKIEKVLLKLFSVRTTSVIVGFVFFVSSFGVYLGRFLRFNSWDIITDAILFLKTIKSIFFNPTTNIQVFAYTILFFLLFYSMYFTFKNFKLE